MLTPIPIGDLVEKYLSRFGITSARIERWLRLPEGGCGCSGRKTGLNAWGYRVQYGIIMFIGGPAPLHWKVRWRIVREKLRRRCRTIITSCLASLRRNGSGDTQR